jgi:hypothetical protein
VGINPIYFLKMITIDSVSPDAETVVNDNGGLQAKCEFDLTLVPPLVLLDVAKVLSEGKNKYGLYNYRKIPINDHMNHALIHIFAHLSGDRQEGEIGHLTHALCRLFFAAEMTQIENGISVK